MRQRKRGFLIGLEFGILVGNALCVCVHFHFLLLLLTQVIESNPLLCSSVKVKNDRDGMTLCCHGEGRAIMVSRCGTCDGKTQT